jgi:hypothetical protein
MQLKHVSLYAKGWYEKTDNVFEDLKKILTLDDYTPFVNNDVFIILVHEYQRIKPHFDLATFISEIQPRKASWHGYNPKEGEWDLFTAVVYYILSEFKFLDREATGRAVPKYSKQFPKPKGIATKTVIETFSTKAYEKRRKSSANI